MSSTIKKSLILILVLFLTLFPSFAMAIDCEYPDASLTISYDDKNNVTLDYSKFSGKPYYQNLLAIVKWGAGTYSTSEIELDQTLFNKYGGYACPSEMYVCEYGEWSLSLPGIVSLGYEVADLVTQIPCWLGAINSGACNDINENAYSVLTINAKKLYILTQEEYEDSDLPGYEGGFFHNDIDDAGDEGYEACGGNNAGWGWKLLGGICGLGWGIIDGIVIETFTDGVDLVYYKYANCDVVPYTGPYIAININCAKLTQKIYEFREAVYNYTQCSDAYCFAEKRNKVNEVEDGIKSYCSNVLQEYDYKDGQAGCIDTCLTIKETLNSFKEGTDLYDDGSNVGQCNVSARLLVWVSNILKWIKYILPVAVIVLGILDFIKAIGSDKDDEMKKAQGRFIKRLIAAALVFLIPLILEFVLDKMGFGYDDCGLF